jgi:hypothetical protein
MSDLNLEDQKLVTLAKGARARIGALAGACVRDTDGRTYSGASVKYLDRSYSAVELAITTALAAGAVSLEAVCVVGEETIDLAAIKTILQTTGSVIVCDAQGAVVSVIN